MFPILQAILRRLHLDQLMFRLDYRHHLHRRRHLACRRTLFLDHRYNLVLEDLLHQCPVSLHKNLHLSHHYQR
jgi:hypothetical protein